MPLCRRLAHFDVPFRLGLQIKLDDQIKTAKGRHVRPRKVFQLLISADSVDTCAAESPLLRMGYRRSWQCRSIREEDDITSYQCNKRPISYLTPFKEW